MPMLIINNSTIIYTIIITTKTNYLLSVLINLHIQSTSLASSTHDNFQFLDNAN